MRPHHSTLISTALICLTVIGLSVYWKPVVVDFVKAVSGDYRIEGDGVRSGSSDPCIAMARKPSPTNVKVKSAKESIK
jgi:hypothetical protein